MANKAYELAKEAYAAIGVNTEAAMERVKNIPVSIHCWQGDDVRGFENPDGDLTGGIQTTGNYPGRARTISELRSDIEKAFSLIPGTKRLSLHAIYLDNLGEKVARNKIEPKHFASWIDWAKERRVGLDFNPTCFSHEMSADGFTLSHPSKAVRDFWIEHCIASRKIAEYIGREMNDTTVTNYWVPDGFKDIPVDRYGARERLVDSLDQIFAGDVDTKHNLNGVESKVFGIGAESCTIGSHEFYMGYAMKNKLLLTLDAGHYHPTEVISDKISSVLLYLDDILLHVSRPVRWDSDHVVIMNDETLDLCKEIVRCDALGKVHIGLDFFDASINRIGAYVIGSRATQKCLLQALLEPLDTLRDYESRNMGFERLALLEECKSMPWGAVWDMFCLRNGVPAGDDFIPEVQKYEKEVLSKR